MNTKKAIITIVVVIVVAAATMICLKPVSDDHHIENESLLMYEITVDLTLPENNRDGGAFWTGTACLVIPENLNLSSNLVDDILSQYTNPSLGEPIRENGKSTYFVKIAAELDNYLLEHNVPPIRQDNENVRFCFYTYVHNIVVGGTPWWDHIGCDSLTFTLILPENYELVSDITEPFGGDGGYKDNDFSIFTSASTLSKEVKDNRWTVTANWEAGKFDKYNTDFYLEIHYENLFF